MNLPSLNFHHSQLNTGPSEIIGGAFAFQAKLTTQFNMQSFRTEFEDPLVEKDIIDLEKKIRLFREGKIDEEKFRSLRLARGVYGQRQQGVQMVRIKIPLGRLSPKQLIRIADVSTEYSNGRMHLTTRQDIQIHHVSLDRTPELWAELERDEITLREACGNTIRNVTASPESGITTDELFDVTPHALAVFKYFLRKPFGQELGRKIKIAFSANDKDSAFTFIHDFGFIPRIEKEERGFKVMIGGGLGAQPFLAKPAYEFLPENEIIPFIEASVRVFDRYGERSNRHKARLKYLINQIGIEEFIRLVSEEKGAVANATHEIDKCLQEPIVSKIISSDELVDVENKLDFKRWLDTNTFLQKQNGYSGVYIKVPLGNIDRNTAYLFAQIADKYASDDIRITVNQGFLLRFVRNENLSTLYTSLLGLGLGDAGFDSPADITACPGTDTCNLAISNSTHVSLELERVVQNEFPHHLYERNLRIKISGCMNSCGQHGLAQIGFHGSSFKSGENVVPALQLVLGGGETGSGEGRIGDKIIKIASKRSPDLLRSLLSDFDINSASDESFNSFYDRKGKDYFYQLLKPLADASQIDPSELIDWGGDQKFKPAIGVGECAGVLVDLVATLLLEADEKLEWSAQSFDASFYSDSVYHSYAAMISAAKAILLDRAVHCNTQHGIISDFDKQFPEIMEKVDKTISFKELTHRINQQKPSPLFSSEYLLSASQFVDAVRMHREIQKV